MNSQEGLVVYRGYLEADLVKNRASLLLFGGTATEREAWAEEAQQNFPEEGPLREVTRAEELTPALAQGRGVLYLPDVTALGPEAQGQVTRCLREREEHPKVIVGLPLAPMDARDRGLLRDDLCYCLQNAQVNLSAEEIREHIRVRRQEAAKTRPEKARETNVPARAASGLAKRAVKGPAQKKAGNKK